MSYIESAILPPPRMPDIGVSSIVSPVASTTGAEAITFDRPFEHDKKLPVLADVVRTP